MKNTFHRNRKGIALLQALMVTAFVGAAAGVIMSQMRLTENTLQVPRIRSEMLIAESAFRNFVYMNGTYTNTGDTGVASTAAMGVSGSANAWLSGFESKLNNLCPAGGNCQILFQPVASATYVGGNKYDFDKPNRTMKTRIVYTGANITVKPIDISIVVPEHILTGAPFRCAAINPGLPFFRGYSGGDPVCTGWPAHQDVNGATCPSGEFMSAVDNQTMQITCLPLTANPNFNCGGNTSQYISNINWGAISGGVLTYTCANRPNPFTYYGF